MPEVFTGLVGIAIIVFLVILSVLWFILPFAIFAIKDNTKRIAEELVELNVSTDETNRLLKILVRETDQNKKDDLE